MIRSSLAAPLTALAALALAAAAPAAAQSGGEQWRITQGQGSARSGPAVDYEFFKLIEMERTRELVDRLFRGANPEQLNERGESALQVAARNGNQPALDALLAAGANINARNALGNSAIMLAALQGHLDTVRYLRGKGAEINHPGWTALHYAATGGSDRIVRYLLDQGADPLARSPNGTTPLMMAARENNTDAIAALLEYGADPAQQNDNGQTALSMAQRLGKEAAVRALQQSKVRSERKRVL